MKSILRAVFGAFLPASATIWGLVLAMVVINQPRVVRSQTLITLGMEWSLLAIGYGVALLWLPRYRFDRRWSPLSHAVAGIAAPVILLALSVVVQRPSTAGIAVLSFAVGASVGLLQWLRARRPLPPPPPTLEMLEREAEAALARALAEAAPSTDVIPLRRPDHTPPRPRDEVA